MTAAATAVVKRLLLSAGYYHWRLRRDRFPGVAVLTYHGIRDDAWPAGAMVFERLHVRQRELEAHCRLLRETCHPISLAEWRAATRANPLPPRAVLLTFDDGYRTMLTHAWPVLERYQIPAAVFVCSDPVERQELFWHDAVAKSRGEPEVERVKTISFEQWRTLHLVCAQPAADGDPHAPLTPDDVRALAAGGLEVGAHTASHAILSRAPATEQREEIRRCKLRLEQWSGRPVTAFAYPNGRPGTDYTRRTIRLVKSYRFDFGFTTYPGFSGPEDPPLERSRFPMRSGISAAELAHRLCHSWPR